MSVIVKPLVTEKMTSLTEKLNRFGFVVKKSANKIQIKDAIEKTYGVAVTEVNTMVYAGKARSRFTKSGVLNGSTNAFKKAIVTLDKGETIDFYSNI
jgi:large subunit ribosomal protein L23